MPAEAENVVELGVPVEQVWQALTTTAGLTSFLCDEAEVEPGAGGSVRIGWNGQMLDAARIEVWEPGRRLHLRGNGVAEEWTLQAIGTDHGSTRVRLVFSGYGDTDWDDVYDAFDATGAFILELLTSWLDEHAGARPRQHSATAELPGDRASAWRAAFGTGIGGLALAADPATVRVGDSARLRLAGGDPIDARVQMYAHANELILVLPSFGGARLTAMVRDTDGSGGPGGSGGPDAAGAWVTFGLISYDGHPAADTLPARLDATARALSHTYAEARPDLARS